MNFCKLFGMLLVLLFPAYAGSAQIAKPTNYSGTPDTIMFEGRTYHLAWTSHPAPSYFKQEYLPEGDKPELFTKMLLLEAIAGKMALSDVVSDKVAELKKMKETNPVVHYELFEKEGEFMLDFLLSVNTKDGEKTALAEHNVYRYRTERTTDGIDYVVLFGISERSYGDDIATFLPGLKERRYDLINAVGQFEIPAMRIAH